MLSYICLGAQRGSGKGRGGASTLPYVIPCTTDIGQTSDSSDGTTDDKRGGDCRVS